MAGEIGSALISGGASIANTLINQAFAEGNRERNYYWNEKAADSADKRQRAQYQDLYSPQAQLKQYAAAGLSPSMMMSGGQSAVGGTPQGAQGGISGPYPGGELINPQAAADIMLKKAQKDNIDADTKGKDIDNKLKNIELGIKNEKYFADIAEQRLLQLFIYNNPNNPDDKSSFAQYALDSKNYDNFKNKINKLDKIDEETKQFINTERGEQVLRGIYESTHKTETEVQKMLGDKGYAQITQDIVDKLNENGFAELSANAQTSDLRRIAQTSELEADQKKTINELFDKIENENIRAFAMVLYMIANRYLGSINANVNANNSTINKN